MKNFNFKECTSENAVSIKQAMRRNANNAEAQRQYALLLEDTKNAISNLEECLNSEQGLKEFLGLMKQGNLTFITEVIGVFPKGNNNSLYRSYLALDEKNIVEIRVGGHYTTKKAALDKSNNLSQFLFQVVLITPDSQMTGKNQIMNTGKVANLRVITQKYITADSSINDLISLLKSLHDYLMNPTQSYEQSLTSQNTRNNQKN